MSVRIAAPLVALLLSCTGSDNGSAVDPRPTQAGASTQLESDRTAAVSPPDGGTSCISGDPFDVEAARSRVSYLASPELGGRVPGTAGDASARAFIAERFRCLGLTSTRADGSYEVPFVSRSGAHTANVVGYLRGTDPIVGSDIIVVGAHHDHFGTGGGKGLRLGANDNASGIAGLLSVAQAIRQRATPPRRTIVFVAFGSEEPSYPDPFTEGSARYVKDLAPADLPTARIVYMINMDMIGSYSQEKLVYALGSLKKTPAHPIMKELTSATPGLKVSLGERGDEGGSDFYPFCTTGIPYVFFWTSDNSCYHKKCDTADKIDYPHLSGIAHLAADLTAALGDTNTDLAEFRRKASVPELGCSESAR